MSGRVNGKKELQGNGVVYGGCVIWESSSKRVLMFKSQLRESSGEDEDHPTLNTFSSHLICPNAFNPSHSHGDTHLPWLPECYILLISSGFSFSEMFTSSFSSHTHLKEILSFLTMTLPRNLTFLYSISYHLNDNNSQMSIQSPLSEPQIHVPN